MEARLALDFVFRAGFPDKTGPQDGSQLETRAWLIIILNI